MASTEKEVATLCGFCHAGCGTIAHVTDGVLGRVRGDPNHPASGGYICPKGANARQVVYAPDRLVHPLRKTSSGFKQVSWNEALDVVSTRLMEIRSKYGGEVLVRCSGAPVTEMARDAFIQLLTSYGSANWTGASHLCHVPRTMAFETVYGRMSQPDYRNTKCIIVWGANPSESRRYGDAEGGDSNYGKIFQVFPEAKKRGAKLIVIDPRRIDLAGKADKYLPIEPGTDDALALAMLNVIVGEKLYHKEFVSKWTVGFDQLTEHVKKFTPEWAQPITKLPAADIREVARTYATTKPAVIREGNFVDQHINAIQTTRAIAILTAITGNLDVEGGNAFFPISALSPIPAKPAKVKALSAARYPLFPRLPFPAFMDAVLTGDPYTPRAMIAYHSNPALINANSVRVQEALKKLDFLVVCDIFMTATAELADVILPESTEFERYDFRRYTSSDGGFVAIKRKVIEPVGGTRSGIEIEYELAKRMGFDKDYAWTNDEGWINHRLKASGITLQQLEEKSVIYTTPPVEYRKYLKKGFHMPSGKVEIYSQKLKDLGYSPLPDYCPLDMKAAPGLIDNYPLIATTRRPGAYTHTRFRNIPALRKLEPDILVRLNPENAIRLGIAEGDPARVESPLGVIEVKAMVTDEVSPGVVIVDFGWGNPTDGGANVNLLTSDEERDPISCTTANRRFRCRVTKVPEGSLPPM